MTHSELQQVLAETGLTPSRKLGQNFLVDQNIAAWIVRQLDLQPENTVVEVGPGTGALTEFLAKASKSLILVELDRRLADFLSRKFDAGVHPVDACHFDTRTLFPLQPVKLIGNLPYSAGGEIIRNFLGPHSPVREAVLMLQREVAERLCAEPGSKNYGLLSLRVQSRWKPKLLKHIGPEAFHPRPQIDSTVLRLTLREPGEFPTYDLLLFDSLLRRGFSQRRKQLKKNLGVAPERFAEIAEKLGFSETVRAEELTLRQWIDLTNLLDKHPLRHHAQKGDELFDVVDEQDNVIGQKTRAEVHREGLLHRAVHIFVFNKAGDLFLQKRSRRKDVHPGRWDSSAAGHLEPGESYAACAVRELDEECGLEAEVERLARIPPSEATGWEFVELYRADATGKIRWPASEVEFGQFFPLAIIQNWITARPEDFATGFLECWEAFHASSGS